MISASGLYPDNSARPQGCGFDISDSRPKAKAIVDLSVDSAVYDWEHDFECVECGKVCDGILFNGLAGYPKGRWLLMPDRRLFHIHSYLEAHPTRLREVNSA